MGGARGREHGGSTLSSPKRKRKERENAEGRQRETGLVGGKRGTLRD